MINTTSDKVSLQIPVIRFIALTGVLALVIVHFFPTLPIPISTVSLFTPMIIFICALILNKPFILDRWTSEIYVFLLLWLCYAIVGLLWTINYAVTIDYIWKILIYTLTFIVFSQLFRNRKYLCLAPLIFQLVIYVYCVIYVWEILTGNHLPGSRLYGISLPLPTGFYYNENNSAVFVLLLSPYLRVKTHLTSSMIGKVVALLVFLLLTAVAVIQNSRLAMVLMLMLGIYFFFRSGWLIRALAVVTIIIGFVSFVVFFPTEYKALQYVMKYQIKLTKAETGSYAMTSSSIRNQLNRESINLLSLSKFLGVSGGNYEVYLNKARYHKTSWVINPHNWWLEILANFGLLVALGMVFIYLRWLYRLFRQRQCFNNKGYSLNESSLISLLMFIPLSIIPSSIRHYYSVWAYFAFIHSVCLLPLPKEHIIANQG
ncbi:MAG: O-antigen ligase family protein [Candidatus Cloacimonetes bacterium]|nr:O-antigen ligase family protein [Candidatus Cloacimonadota bacterium]